MAIPDAEETATVTEGIVRREGEASCVSGRLRTWGLLGLNLAVSSIALYFVFLRLDSEEIGRTLRSLDAGWLSLSAAAFMSNYLLRTVRLQGLIPKPSPRAAVLFAVASLHGLANYLLPARLGELAHIWLLKAYGRQEIKIGFWSLLMTRFLDASVVAAALAVFLPLAGPATPSWALLTGTLFCLLTLGMAAVLFAWLPHLATSPPTNSRPRPLPSLVYRVASSFTNQLHTYQVARLFFLSSLIWICVFINFYAICKSLGADVSILQMITLSMIMIPAGLIPAQGFANVGSHELVWITVLVSFGMNSDDAVNTAVGAHLILIALIIAQGLIGLAAGLLGAYLNEGRQRRE